MPLSSTLPFNTVGVSFSARPRATCPM